MEQNDFFALSARIKNHIAFEGLALSDAGIVLVNMQTHYLRKLYDFSTTLPLDQKREFQKLLEEGEELPKAILKILTPRPDEEELDEESYSD